MIKDGDNSMIGNPTVENAKIEAEVVDHDTDDKLRVYKYKRRTKYRRTRKIFSLPIFKGHIALSRQMAGIKNRLPSLISC
jgi:hypothetical protein